MRAHHEEARARRLGPSLPCPPTGEMGSLFLHNTFLGQDGFSISAVHGSPTTVDQLVTVAAPVWVWPVLFLRPPPPDRMELATGIQPGFALTARRAGLCKHSGLGILYSGLIRHIGPEQGRSIPLIPASRP